MTYSDFDLKAAVDTFGLAVDRTHDLFADVPPLEPSPGLTAWFADFARMAIGLRSETARREFIIAPLLAEAKRRTAGPINVLPGVTVDIDRARGLAGNCDYVVSRSEEYYYLRSPLVAVVEAKRDDLIPGLGQCAAEMVAIRLFNERDGTTVPAEYGVVTSGANWQFLKLHGQTLYIDTPLYSLREPGKILGILVHIFGPPA